MNLLPLALAISPILIVFFLLLVKRTAADTAGWIGWLCAVAVACLYFQTDFVVAARSSLSGVIASFPITLMVATSIFQITVMLETGAITRIVRFIRSISPGHQVVQIMIVNMGFGTLLAALGATPVSILPPIMAALGYSSLVSIALPAIGYDALCTYALLGIPVVVFSNFVGRPIDQVGGYFAQYMPVISSCIAVGMLWIVGRWRMIKAGIIPAIISGAVAGVIAIMMNSAGMVTLSGVAAGIGIIGAMILYLRVTNRRVFEATQSAGAQADEPSMTLFRAASPWILLTFFALLVNAPFLPFFDFTFKQLSMPVPIIPKAPERLRLFWQAYFWILASTLLSFPILKPSTGQIARSLRKWCLRAPRPMAASAVFFAIAFVYSHSGKSGDWVLIEAGLNMVSVIAEASASTFGAFYPLIAPFLGLFAGFISGSEASSIAMLTELHLKASEQVGANGLLVAAASGIGGGLASVISPAKLQNAAASIDRIGEEARVIPLVLVISILITAVCALMTLFLS